MGPGTRPRGRSVIRRREVLASAGVGVASGLAGCGYIGSGDADADPLEGETINVGVLAPASAPEGVSLRRGAELAADHINEDGGIGGARIELVEADVGADLAGDSAAEHDRLCGEVDCAVTVGLLFGRTVRAVLPSIADHETVHLTTGAFDGRLGATVGDDYDDYRYHFRAGLPDLAGMADAFGEFVETHAADIGWDSAAIYTDDVGGFEALHDRLVGRVADHLDVPLHGQLSGLGGSYHGLFDDVEAEGCDVLLLNSSVRGTAAVEQWAGDERAFALGGFDVIPGTRPDLWSETGGDAESLFTVNALTPASRNTPATMDFVADYEAAYGGYPMYTGALTYDALGVYRAAVETRLDGGDDGLPAQDAIVEALEQITYEDGVVYRSFEFTGPEAGRVHEPVWTSMAVDGVPVVQQWQRGSDGDGVMEAIAPERNRTARYQPPPWLRE